MKEAEGHENSETRMSTPGAAPLAEDQRRAPEAWGAARGRGGRWQVPWTYLVPPGWEGALGQMEVMLGGRGRGAAVIAAWAWEAAWGRGGGGAREMEEGLGVLSAVWGVRVRATAVMALVGVTETARSQLMQTWCACV